MVNQRKARVILHVDMNSFYASVEQAKNPQLRGKPLAIAGNPQERRGIIITCSYEARAFGVYTTMTVHEARKLCPELIIMPPNFPTYRKASQAMFAILRSYTELVEPVSIDEGYMDITALSEKQHALAITTKIQQQILQELKLPCSIGVAPNKCLAKTASDMQKPLGITVLRKRDVQAKLWPLPVIEMHGIGASTAEKLKKKNILTIGDLAKSDAYAIKLAMGKIGVRLRERANGDDRREVDPLAIYDTKSVGNSTTLPRDETDIVKIQQTLNMLAAKVAQRLVQKGLVATTISVQLRDNKWHNRTRSQTLQNAMADEQQIATLAIQLFEAVWQGEPLRLLGINASNLLPKSAMTEQLSLFNYERYAKDEPILKTIDAIEQKFGKGIIQKGISVPQPKQFLSTTSFSKDFLDDHLE